MRLASHSSLRLGVRSSDGDVGVIYGGVAGGWGKRVLEHACDLYHELGSEPKTVVTCLKCDEEGGSIYR